VLIYQDKSEPLASNISIATHQELAGGQPLIVRASTLRWASSVELDLLESDAKPRRLNGGGSLCQRIGWCQSYIHTCIHSVL